ncbi:MAG: redoxin domain-containing protein, partial [Planctomycetales bacterium]|nr:redoxin domain-containing protein [Planctomycetales bacterium]
LKDLRGKFVVLDFWTYCCINCMHVLPELKKLERAYPNELVVIGVHCAKFDREKGLADIEEAILRYEIEHPVVNDPEHDFWNRFGVRSWPTLVVIDPQGRFLGSKSGETEAEPFINLLQATLPYFREQKLVDATPLKFDLLRDKQNPSPLRFPGKVLADEKSQRLFIADSNHNRIVIATLDGQLIDTVGNGAIGRDDGGFADATFNKPQGMALYGDVLYVADTENHMLRKIDLAAKKVFTVAGDGTQGRDAFPIDGDFDPTSDKPPRFIADPKMHAINSPWDLWINGDDLYIAMAGPHQIWKMPLDESEIGPYAGNGREDIVDGPRLPSVPYEQGASSFAQPSGLTSDGQWLYVADSEGSSVRAVPLDPALEVRTILGTSGLAYNRLFEFGHRDGPASQAKLQHCLGVAYHDGKIYVADTYNNAIKRIDLEAGECVTIAGAPAEAEALPANDVDMKLSDDDLQLDGAAPKEESPEDEPAP